jgi:hypothetical protein
MERSEDEKVHCASWCSSKRHPPDAPRRCYREPDWRVAASSASWVAPLEPGTSRKRMGEVSLLR